MTGVQTELPPFRADPKKFNPTFIPFINARETIQLYTGNRGSGKTKFKCQKSIIYALTKNYFRLAYGMKVSDRVRDRLFLTLKGIINEWRVGAYFQIKESSMDILCRLNDNMLLSFGLDDPEKVKGLDEISHVLIDEMTDITFEDYANLKALLRTAKSKYTQFWGLFNPEYNFWGRKYFFLDDENDKIPLGEVAAKTSNTLIYKATFKTNPFINTVEYEANLRELARGNKNYLTVWIDGDWGESVIGNEFYPEFNRVIHVGKAPFIPGKPVHNTYDFNWVPFMTELCWQADITDTEIWLRCFKEYCLPSPLNSTKAVCKAFIDDYGSQIIDFFYYGDATGDSHRAGKANETAFDDVVEMFQRWISSGSKRVLRYNPSILKRRDFINDIFAEKIKYNGKTVKILIDEKCVETIEDFSKVKLGIDGKNKERVHDKTKGITYEKRGHPTDATEYFIIRLLWDIFKLM